MKWKNYISPESYTKIRNFKYKGSSNAISYHQIWQPLANRLLPYIPLYIAPNLITLTGLFIVIISYIIVCIPGHMGQVIGNQRLIVFSLCILIYQTLDNLDGKQARRTNSSSPLGMILDHGCDAMAAFLLSNCVCRIFMIQNENLVIYVVALSSFISYLGVWAQYHSRGLMYLGMINSVDDGISTIWMLALMTTITGMQFWNQIIFLNFRRNALFIYSISVVLVIQTIFFLCSTNQYFTKHVTKAISHFKHLFLTILTLIIIGQTTDWYQQNNYLYAMMFSLGCMFARNISYMQLCVVTKTQYLQFTTANSIFFLAYPLYIFTHKYLNLSIVSQSTFIYCMLIFFIGNYLHFMISVSLELAEILNIKILKINMSLSSQNIDDGKKVC